VAWLRRDVALACLDLFVAGTAYLGPLVVRFEGAVPQRYWENFWRFVPIAVFIHLLSNYLFGLYRQMWRYASVQEARRLLLSGLFSMALVVGAGFWLGGRLRPLPISVVLSGAVLSTIGFGAIRFQSRLFAFRRRTLSEHRTRVLVVGAGDAGAMLMRDLQRHPWLGIDPVVVVDDDPRKQGRWLHGIRVMGTRSSIPELIARHEIDQVLIAIPSAPSSVIREIATICEEAETTVKVLPSVKEIVGEKVTAKDIRDLQIEDLLGRQQVHMDLQAVLEMVRGRRVMVTGAGGSIGSEIVRQLAPLGPETLVLLDHDETHLHDLVTDLDSTVQLEPVLADIRDQDRVNAVFVRHAPEVVFHAAAHKHVPILEEHPQEALVTNVFGTANVAEAALRTGVQRFVLISTDKAVRPVSVMGASKRFAEQIVRTLLGNGCVLCSVRFGNVLGSRGSVIPTFLKQISHGGPVTVTDPTMQRYFMSLQEAVQLVLQAAALSKGGELFTLDMGEPMNVLELARKLIRLSGRAPGEVAISLIGPRPGEKTTEEILEPEEAATPSAHPGIYVSYPAPGDPATLRRALQQLGGLAAESRTDELAAEMKRLALDELRPLEAVAAR
jgi:FlaA1/EpsC-like NDP-sugar epimerase